MLVGAWRHLLRKAFLPVGTKPADPAQAGPSPIAIHPRHRSSLLGHQNKRDEQTRTPISEMISSSGPRSAAPDRVVVSGVVPIFLLVEGRGRSVTDDADPRSSWGRPDRGAETRWARKRGGCLDSQSGGCLDSQSRKYLKRGLPSCWGRAAEHQGAPVGFVLVSCLRPTGSTISPARSRSRLRTGSPRSRCGRTRHLRRSRRCRRTRRSRRDPKSRRRRDRLGTRRSDPRWRRPGRR